MIPHQTLFQHELGYCVAYHLTYKALHTKRHKHHFYFWNLSKYKTWREKNGGDMAYYVPPVSKSGGTRPPCPPPNSAHGRTAHNKFTAVLPLCHALFLSSDCTRSCPDTYLSYPYRSSRLDMNVWYRGKIFTLTRSAQARWRRFLITQQFRFHSVSNSYETFSVIS